MQPPTGGYNPMRPKCPAEFDNKPCNYNNNNNTLIYIAPACRMTSEALEIRPAQSPS